MKTTLRRGLVFSMAVGFMLATAIGLSHQTNALSTEVGDGILTYGQSANTMPKWRTYGMLSNTFGTSQNTVTSTSARNTIIKTSPIKQEATSGYVGTDNVLHVLCYNGTSWTEEWTQGVGGTGGMGRFDIAYEKTTGDTMIVYSTNTTGSAEMAYRTKPGSSSCGAANWSSGTNIDAVRTSGTVLQVRLEASFAVSSNNIGLAWSDSANALSAKMWTGVSWAVAEPAAALTTDLERITAAGDSPSFDIAIDRSNGNFYVVWGKYNAGGGCTANDVSVGLVNACILWSRYTAGAWTTPAVVTNAADEATVIDISAHPTSDELMMGAIGNFEGDFTPAYWSGSAWNTFANRDGSASVPTAGTKLVATGWLKTPTSGTTRGVVVYADATAPTSNISYNTYRGATNTSQPDFVPVPTPAAFQWMDIQSDPFNTDRLLLVFSDANADLFAKQLVMADTADPLLPSFTWNNADGGVAALETDLGQATSSPFSYAYWRYVPGVLGVDIVDGAGTPVPGPTSDMSTVVTSNTCQTATGILGIVGQRIRVTNASASPAWTLSIAATGGTTTPWSSGVDNYDFNDPSGSPAGCADGVDADSLAGRLSVNPSVGSITPKTGCTNTGVGLGSSSAFNQGTIDNITLMTASGSASLNCYWDLLGVGLSQSIPAYQAPGTYGLNMTMTVVAN